MNAVDIRANGTIASGVQTTSGTSWTLAGNGGNTVIVSNTTTSIALPDLTSSLLDGAKYKFIFQGTSATTFTVNTTGLFVRGNTALPITPV